METTYEVSDGFVEVAPELSLPTSFTATAADVSGYDIEVGPLIRSLDGERLDPPMLRNRLTRVLYNVGVKQGPHDGRSPHVLRRTCATTLLESGASIRDVQRILGHASIATTERYLALPDTRRLLDLVDRGPMAEVPSVA